MPDSAEQLQRLYMAGFELETFERFPKAIGVLRQGYVAFLVPGPDGLQILGNDGIDTKAANYRSLATKISASPSRTATDRFGSRRRRARSTSPAPYRRTARSSGACGG